MSLKMKTHIINFIILLHGHVHTYTKAERGNVSEHTDTRQGDHHKMS